MPELIAYYGDSCLGAPIGLQVDLAASRAEAAARGMRAILSPVAAGSAQATHASPTSLVTVFLEFTSL